MKMGDFYFSEVEMICHSYDYIIMGIQHGITRSGEEATHSQKIYSTSSKDMAMTILLQLMTMLGQEEIKIR